jgi:hypothetical protein
MTGNAQYVDHWRARREAPSVTRTPDLSPAASGRGIACTRIGGPLSFEPIWQRLGIGAVLNALLQGRGLEFAVERAVFASVLRQLFVSGSDSTDFVARPSGR